MPALIFAETSGTRGIVFDDLGVQYRSGAQNFPLLTTDVVASALSPTGDLLAVIRAYLSGGDQAKLYVFETRGFQLVQTLTLADTNGNSGAYSLAFSPDGTKLAATMTASPYLQIWNTSSWALYSAVDVPFSSGGVLQGDNRLLAWSPDSRYLAMHGRDTAVGQDRLRVYDANTTSPVQVTAKLAVASHFGGGVAWSPDGTRLIVGLHESVVNIPTIYETTGWTAVANPTGYPSNGRPHNIGWQGNYVLIAGETPLNFLYAYDTGGSVDATTWTLTSHTLPATVKRALLTEGASVIRMVYHLGGSNNRTYIATPPTQAIGLHVQTTDYGASNTVYGLSAREYDPGLENEGKLIAVAVGTTAPGLKFYNQLGVELGTVTLSPALNAGYSVHISADGTKLVTTDIETGTNFWRPVVYDFTGTYNRLAILTTFSTDDFVNFTEFSPDGTKIAVTPGQAPGLLVYNGTTYAAYSALNVAIHSTGYNYPGFISWSPDSRYVAVTTYVEDTDETVRRVYDTQTTTPTLVVAASQTSSAGSYGGSGAFSPDGTRFLSGIVDDDMTIKLFETTGWTTVALPADVPTNAEYIVQWIGDYIYLISQNDRDNYIYDTQGSTNTALWTLTPFLGYRLNTYKVVPAPGGTIPAVVAHDYQGIQKLVRLYSPADEHWITSTRFLSQDDVGGGNVFDVSATSAEIGGGGDTVDGEIDEEMAGADSTEGVPLKFVIEALAGADVNTPSDIKNILEALGLTDAWQTQIIVLLAEQFGISDSLLSSQVLNALVNEAFASLDDARPALVGLVSEIAALEDQPALLVQFLVSVVESMVADDVVSSRAAAIGVVALALTFGDELLNLTLGQIEEIMDSNSEYAAKMVANLVLIELADASASIVAGRTLLLSVAEGAAGADQLDPFATIQALLTEGMELEVELILFGEKYQGWVVNTETGAPTEYENFNFNSMCKLGQKYYGAAENGLFMLDGETDDGDPINARILTGEMDFGSPNLKRLERAYMGYTSEGDMVLRIIVTHAGKPNEYWYKVPTRFGSEDTESRIKIGEGIFSNYWQFELVNPDGAHFKIERWLFDIRYMQRRV